MDRYKTLSLHNDKEVSLLNVVNKRKICQMAESISSRGGLHHEAIERSLGPLKIKKIRDLSEVYARLMCGSLGVEIFCSYYGVGSLIIRLASYANHMSDEEASFVKDCLENHIFYRKTMVLAVQY